MFTIDKLIGSVVKQVCVYKLLPANIQLTTVFQAQTILSDSRSQDIFDLLRKERELTSPTTQDLINSRKNTERILGPDENLFRMVWVRRFVVHARHMKLIASQIPESKTVTIQLLGKDDSTLDDSEALSGRWQAYVESYVSVRPAVVFCLCLADTPYSLEKQKAWPQP